MYAASAQKGTDAPMRVTRKQVEALPALYRALAEICLEQNTGDLILVEGS
jgi:hypothetical protein